MRVLHVVESFGGGVVTVLLPLLNRQAVEHEVHLWHSCRAETPAVLDLSPAVFRTVLPMPASPGLAVLRSALDLAKRITELAPDVIHLHSSMAGVIGRLAALHCRFPMSRVLYTPHGLSFLRQDKSWAARKVFHAVESLLAMTGSPIVACSQEEGDLCAQFSDQVLVARNGIDLQQVAAQSVLRAEGPFTVAALGRVCPARAPDDFAKVANLVKRKNPGIRFVWLGWNDTAEDGRSKEVDWLGAMPRDSALAYLSGSTDVLLHASLWEGLPLAVLEAMALGKPVVARNVVGNREAVLSSSSGYLADTVDEMATAILRLAADADLRQRMGRAGYQRVADLFTVDRQAEQLLAIYRNSLTGKQAYLTRLPESPDNW